MGPGYFPLLLSSILIIIGIIIMVQGLLSRTKDAFVYYVPWRGVAFLVAAVLAFILLSKFAGLLTSVFLTVFLASLADRDAKLSQVILVSAVASIFCTLVFTQGLKLPIPAIVNIFK
jgi:hypothetical protein